MKKKSFFDTVKVIVSVCGGWWALMSGAISVPFTVAAFLTQGREKAIYWILSYGCLFLFALRLSWRNYEILTIQQPAQKLALFSKMVDFIKSSKEQNDKTKAALGIAVEYVGIMQPSETIGALVKFADEIRSEADLDWFAIEFEKLGYKPPFKHFKPILDKELNGRWLPVLLEARLRPEEIKKETEFLSFLATTWSGKEKWHMGQNRKWENEMALLEQD